MGPHEIVSFRRILSAFPVRISIFDLLERTLLPRDLEDIDLVLMGGSGKYSATSTDPWLEVALDSLRLVHASQVPRVRLVLGLSGHGCRNGRRGGARPGAGPKWARTSSC